MNNYPSNQETVPNLYHIAIKGGFWNLFLRGIEFFSNFIKLIILTKLLAPQDFGIIGLAMSIIAFIDAFTQTGFQEALIQKKSNIVSYLNTVWVVVIFRSIIICLILFTGSSLFAIFFNAPELKNIIQIIALIQILHGFKNIGIVYFDKELDFKKVFHMRIYGISGNLVVSIVLACFLKNVWALIWGMAVEVLLEIFISYRIQGFRPRFFYDHNQAKELFRFGLWIFLANVLVFLVTEADNLFVGKVLGISSLGFYAMAYRISNTPVTEFAHVISRVSFPLYSKLQNEIPNLRVTFLKVFRLVSFFVIPFSVFNYIFAPDYIPVLFSSRWMPMVWPIRIFCIFGIFRALQNTFGAVYNCIGKPRLITEMKGIDLIIVMLLIYPFSINWNIIGTSITFTISIIFSFVYGIKKISEIFSCSILNIILTISKIFTASFLAGLIIVCFRILFFKIFNFGHFLFLLLIGILFYLTIIIFWDHDLKDNLRSLIKAFI